MSAPIDPAPRPQIGADEGLIRAIGVPLLAANVVNLTVGAGIFVLPAVVAGLLGAAAIGAYVACGLLMGLVLLCYADVGGRVTRSGGSYAYVEAAFGPYAAFLVGTLLWLVFGVLSNAAVASILVGTLGKIMPAFARPTLRIATLGVLYGVLWLVNVRGVKQGARLSLVTTLAKLVPLLALVAIGLPAVRGEHFALPSPLPVDQLGAAALVLFFAFGGPETALSASGEIRDPARTVPRGLLLGALGVLVLYVLLQTVAQGVLGPALATETAAPLAETARRVIGPVGAGLLLIGAALSTFGTVSADLIGSPRVLFATARDGLLPRVLGRVHPRFHTPYVALTVYVLLAFGFAASGTFEFLAATASAGLLLVYLGVCLATLVLGRRDRTRPEGAFRLPGGPVIPLLAAAVIVWLLTFSQRNEATSLGLLLLVVSVVYVVQRRVRATASDA